MTPAARVHQFLRQHAVAAQSIAYPRGLDFAQVIERAQAVPELTARTYVLIDRQGPVAVVLPYPAELDLDLLNVNFNRHLQRLDEHTAQRIFRDCVAHALPPFGMAYNIPVIVDADLLNSDHVFVPAGCGQTLLRIEGRDFRTLMQGAKAGHVARWSGSQRTHGAGLNTGAGNLSLGSVSRKLESVFRLPPMPETAVNILHLTADPDATVNALATLIERDPSLCAQLMRYARSPLFGYRGELKTIQDAVTRVLGFDRVSKLAMSIAASRAFTISRFGPLGLERFWQHALYNGVLSQALALMVKPELQVNDKDAYLAGLLHNFGILLIGHLFPSEFKLLNRLREEAPQASLGELEQQVFGMGAAGEVIAMGHGSIGAILLKMWQLPASTVRVAGMHQNLLYEGPDQHYVWLVQLANHFLAQRGIGDEPSALNAEPLLAQLGISLSAAQALADATLDQCRELDALVCSMAG